MESYHDYLEHHGVKGQRWGVRRTPEQLGHKPSKKSKFGYAPLKYKAPVMQSSVKAAQYLAATLASSVIPGFATLYNLRTVKSIMDSSFDGRDYIKKDGPIESPSKMRRKTKDLGIHNDMLQVNPRVPGVSTAGTVNNCSYCTFAMEMRRRGYDVRARKKGSGIAAGDINHYFKDVKLEYPRIEKVPGESLKDRSIKAYEKLCRSIEQQGSGARGLVLMKWVGSTAGHMMYYDVDRSGNVSFYDGQNKKVNDSAAFSLSDPDGYSYARLDNVNFTDNIGEAVVSVKDGLFGRRR